MRRRDLTAAAIGAGIGAWVYPLATYFALRLCGRHHLSITTKENPR